MNIKQRALELLQDESLRGRVPSEVQDLLREVAALVPVGYACIAWGNVQKLVRRDDVAGEFVTSHEIYNAASPEVRPVYTLTGATHAPE